MKFQKAFGDRGLTVIGVHDDDTDGKRLETLGSSVAKFGITFPVLLGDDATEEAYGITAIPTRVLVSREGRIVSREVGFSEKQALALERRIRDAIE